MAKSFESMMRRMDASEMTAFFKKILAQGRGHSLLPEERLWLGAQGFLEHNYATLWCFVSRDCFDLYLGMFDAVWALKCLESKCACPKTAGKCPVAWAETGSQPEASQPEAHPKSSSQPEAHSKPEARFKVRDEFILPLLDAPWLKRENVDLGGLSPAAQDKFFCRFNK